MQQHIREVRIAQAFARRWVTVGVLASVPIVASCGSDSNAPPSIASISPDFGPLGGGTRITITGSGFVGDGAEPNRVLIGGVEAPLASAIDDQTLEVLLPPSITAGERAVVVYNRNGYANETGKFHYSALPVITSVQPTRIEYNKTSRIVVTGSGFEKDQAGVPTIMVAGVKATDVTVMNDTTLSFQIGPGLPMSKPDIELKNTVGTATGKALLQYVPSLGKGFLLFSKSNNYFAAFYDPVSHAFVDVPSSATRLPDAKPGYRALYVDDGGNYWAHTRNGEFGQIDFVSQNLTKTVRAGARLIAFEHMGNDVYALARGGQFGRFDITTGEFTAIGNTPVPNGNGCGLALLGNTMFAACLDRIMQINITTGALGAQVAIAPPNVGGFSPHISDMRALDGILYGVTSLGELLTINPTNGITATVEDFGIPVSAMEIFQ